MNGRPNASPGAGRAGPSVAIAIFFLETAMMLRQGGGDTRAGVGITGRFICGSSDAARCQLSHSLGGVCACGSGMTREVADHCDQIPRHAVTLRTQVILSDDLCRVAKASAKIVVHRPSNGSRMPGD